MGGRAVKHPGGARDARGHRSGPAAGPRRHRAAVTLAALLGLAGLSGSACTAAAPPAPKPSPAASASPARSATTPAPAVPAPAASVTLAAVGDMMLGNAPDLPPDPGAYLGEVKRGLDSGASVVALATGDALAVGAGFGGLGAGDEQAAPNRPARPSRAPNRTAARHDPDHAGGRARWP